LKHGHIPILIQNLIALKYDASFEFPVRIISGKIDVLLDTDAKHTSNVVGCARRSCGSGDVSPLGNFTLIPTAKVAKPLPFCFHGLLGFGVINLLFSSYRAGDTCNKREPFTRDSNSVASADPIPKRLLELIWSRRARIADDNIRRFLL
jgi:hypothetical protein